MAEKQKLYEEQKEIGEKLLTLQSKVNDGKVRSTQREDTIKRLEELWMRFADNDEKLTALGITSESYFEQQHLPQMKNIYSVTRERLNMETLEESTAIFSTSVPEKWSEKYRQERVLQKFFRIVNAVDIRFKECMDRLQDISIYNLDQMVKNCDMDFGSITIIYKKMNFYDAVDLMNSDYDAVEDKYYNIKKAHRNVLEKMLDKKYQLEKRQAPRSSHMKLEDKKIPVFMGESNERAEDIKFVVKLPFKSEINFIGAARKLDAELKNAIKDNNNVAAMLEADKVQWHCIPPAALHFGGIWEADTNPLAGSSSSSINRQEDSLPSDTYGTRENGSELDTALAFNEVATLRADNNDIQPQQQFGTTCDCEDIIGFHRTIGDFASTAYRTDLYTHSLKAAMDEPPNDFGHHYGLPNLLKRSEGGLGFPITDYGRTNIRYLIMRPTPSLQLDMRISYSRYWNDKWMGLDAGHRGSGTSFKANDSTIREDTITSLKNAVEHGAHMVEFDVQVSKDFVPIVYHDFTGYVSLKTKSMQQNDSLVLPMREQTLKQHKNLKVYHTAEGQSREARCFKNDEQLEHQPFPTLEEVLVASDPHLGYSVKVKWSQRLKDGTMEEEFEHIVDRNLYVDCMLDVVLLKAVSRRIVPSCFDPGICTMLRFKQNRYPIVFLTIDVTTKYKGYLDPRGKNIQTAVCASLSMELLEIVAYTNPFLTPLESMVINTLHELRNERVHLRG